MFCLALSPDTEAHVNGNLPRLGQTFSDKMAIAVWAVLLHVLRIYDDMPAVRDAKNVPPEREPVG